jgi:hypothetical protein
MGTQGIPVFPGIIVAGPCQESRNRDVSHFSAELMTKWTKTRRDPGRTYEHEDEKQKAAATRRAMDEARLDLPYLLDPGMDDDEAELRYVEGLKRWLPDIKDEEIEEKVRLFRDARTLKKRGGGRSS